MAGDWIKIEHGILGKPEVMLLADALDISHFEAVGHLVAFWLWVDLNLSPTCPCVKGTKKGLDRVAGRDGFSDALLSVGWLSIKDDVISIPNYDNHLSKSAKERAKGQKKKASQRSRLSPSEGDKKGTESGQEGGLEKRREEKNILSSYPQSEDPFFEGIKNHWIRWLTYWEAKWGQRIPETQADIILADLFSRGLETAKEDIDRAILKGWKNILRRDQTFEAVSERDEETKRKIAEARLRQIESATSKGGASAKKETVAEKIERQYQELVERERKQAEQKAINKLEAK